MTDWITFLTFVLVLLIGHVAPKWGWFSVDGAKLGLAAWAVVASIAILVFMNFILVIGDMSPSGARTTTGIFTLFAGVSYVGALVLTVQGIKRNSGTPG